VVLAVVVVVLNKLAVMVGHWEVLEGQAAQQITELPDLPEVVQPGEMVGLIPGAGDVWSYIGVKGIDYEIRMD
jgi:hypothetical protein